MAKDKKVILLVIRRGVSEIEWIAPVINKFNFDFELFTLYLSKASYSSCKTDNLSFSTIDLIQKNKY